MLKIISGAFEDNHVITVVDSTNKQKFHPTVRKDSNGSLFVEINSQYYEFTFQGCERILVLRKDQTPPRLHPLHYRVENTRQEFLSRADKEELLGYLIDVVEDWLEEKGIIPDDIPNSERDNDNPAIIYGSDYDAIADKFSEILGIDREKSERLQKNLSTPSI